MVVIQFFRHFLLIQNWLKMSKLMTQISQTFAIWNSNGYYLNCCFLHVANLNFLWKNSSMQIFTYFTFISSKQWNIRILKHWLSLRFPLAQLTFLSRCLSSRIRIVFCLARVFLFFFISILLNNEERGGTLGFRLLCLSRQVKVKARVSGH